MYKVEYTYRYIIYYMFDTTSIDPDLVCKHILERHPSDVLRQSYLYEAYIHLQDTFRIDVTQKCFQRNN